MHLRDKWQTTIYEKWFSCSKRRSRQTVLLTLSRKPHQHGQKHHIFKPQSLRLNCSPFRQCSKPHRVNVPSFQSFMWMGRASPTSTLILALVGQVFCQSAVTQKKHEKYDLNLEIDLFSEEGCLFHPISYISGSSLQVPKVRRMTWFSGKELLSRNLSRFIMGRK